jgi:hypothetical protein
MVKYPFASIFLKSEDNHGVLLYLLRSSNMVQSLQPNQSTPRSLVIGLQLHGTKIDPLAPPPPNPCMSPEKSVVSCCRSLIGKEVEKERYRESQMERERGRDRWLYFIYYFLFLHLKISCHSSDECCPICDAGKK